MTDTHRETHTMEIMYIQHYMFSVSIKYAI